MRGFNESSSYSTAQFCRAYEMRAPNLMWFLGAGASAASGIQTASSMIWDFKRQLYCTAERVSVAACPDLKDPITQDRLQRFCDGTRRFPPRESEEEYAAYFEATYQDAADRHRYIHRAVRDGKPSYGHVVLGTLLLMGAGRVVWTTNFDTMVEDATIPLLGGSAKLTVAALETAEIARTALTEGRDPVIVKLHGDFRSRRLKNIEGELQRQDDTLRQALVDECRRGGLAVVGYSGRDKSVMDALVEAVAEGRGFPSGLFWFYREDSPPPLPVKALIERARTVGIDAHLIPVETFDELMGDVIALYAPIPEVARARLGLLDRRANRISDVQVAVSARNGAPLVRMNAFPVVEAPAVCRRISCSIGGIRAVREAISAAQLPLIAMRRKTGIHIFGSDVDCRKVFESFQITAFDIQPTESRFLAYDDSQEIGMMAQALAFAIARERPFKVERRGRAFVLSVDPSQSNDQRLNSLTRATKGLTGTVHKTKIVWAEAVRLHLQYRLGRLWLLLEPKIWHATSEDESEVALARKFARERLTSRYNRAVDEILTGWIDAITQGAQEVRLSSLGLREGEGIDAIFVVGRRSAYSRRHESMPIRAESPSPYRDAR